ncbi:hypothetical protein EVAR_7471_1, partial [Eumeta japonica]
GAGRAASGAALKTALTVCEQPNLAPPFQMNIFDVDVILTRNFRPLDDKFKARASQVAVGVQLQRMHFYWFDAQEVEIFTDERYPATRPGYVRFLTIIATEMTLL